MSFIDLTASHVWSAADIANRVQSMIRGRVTAEDELKAARLARKTDATAAEQAFVAEVDNAIEAALQAGRESRADMALLAGVLAIERGESDYATATAEVQELFDQRNPPAPEVIE